MTASVVRNIGTCFKGWQGSSEEILTEIERTLSVFEEMYLPSSGSIQRDNGSIPRVYASILCDRLEFLLRSPVSKSLKPEEKVAEFVDRLVTLGWIMGYEMNILSEKGVVKKRQENPSSLKERGYIDLSEPLPSSGGFPLFIWRPGNEPGSDLEHAMQEPTSLKSEEEYLSRRLGPIFDMRAERVVTHGSVTICSTDPTAIQLHELEIVPYESLWELRFRYDIDPLEGTGPCIRFIHRDGKLVEVKLGQRPIDLDKAFKKIEEDTNVTPQHLSYYLCEGSTLTPKHKAAIGEVFDYVGKAMPRDLTERARDVYTKLFTVQQPSEEVRKLF